ncbi:MAG TPA: NAD(P)-binding domain-containing protein [Thermodesulfobacteriota bacterium]
MFDTIVVGGGQAGLAMGYYLARQGRDFLILDAHARVGDAWRLRWDSLRLFTPARYDALPGMPFLAAPDALPTKDQVADYLEAYAARLGLPVRPSVAVDAVEEEAGRYVLRSGDRRFEAKRVVLATGAFRAPRVPAFSSDLDPCIVQVHSSRYRNLGQLRDGPVLVVGAGNSGAEIALEAAPRHPTWLSGRDTGRLPGLTGRITGPLLWWAASRVLTVDRALGRWARRRAVGHGGPLVGIGPRALQAAGVRRVGRTVGSRGGRPVLEDGQVLDVANVVWCTGFGPDFGFVRLPVLGPDGYPVHDRGVVAGARGLYVLGLPFQRSLASHSIGGVGADAAYIAEAIAAAR